MKLLKGFRLCSTKKNAVIEPRKGTFKVIWEVIWEVIWGFTSKKGSLQDKFLYFQIQNWIFLKWFWYDYISIKYMLCMNAPLNNSQVTFQVKKFHDTDIIFDDILAPDPNPGRPWTRQLSLNFLFKRMLQSPLKDTHLKLSLQDQNHHWRFQRTLHHLSPHQGSQHHHHHHVTQHQFHQHRHQHHHQLHHQNDWEEKKWKKRLRKWRRCSRIFSLMLRV